MEFRILKGKEISDKIFEQMYALLQSSFLREEYRDYERQKMLLNKEIYEVLLVLSGETVVGMTAFWHLSDFVFIEHLVVNKDERSKGIGSKMLQKIKEYTSGSVILEVELPYNEINRKRIGFYERNGFVYNNFEYFQKPLNQGDEPLPLRIMSYPNELSEEKFENIRKRLVKGVYNS